MKPMTARDLIRFIQDSSMEAVLVLCAMPLLTLIIRGLHGRGKGANKPWRYVYSFLVYAVSIPGVTAVVLTGYTLFFTKENLLDQSLVVFILPIVIMFITLMLISKFVELENVPGFDRITGLLALLGITSLGILLLSRLHFFVGFFGSFTMMISVGIFLFLLLKWGAGRVFRTPAEKPEEPPKFSV
jgi:hypothetical protein